MRLTWSYCRAAQLSRLQPSQLDPSNSDPSPALPARPLHTFLHMRIVEVMRRPASAVLELAVQCAAAAKVGCSIGR